MVGKPLFLLSQNSGDWAAQILAGARPDDVLVAGNDMAPFLAEVSPFIKVYFSSYVHSGAVWRMQDKAAQLILQGMKNNESRTRDRKPEVDG